MLSMLDIRKKRDEKGVEIEPVVKFENSIFRSVLSRFVLCCDAGLHLHRFRVEIFADSCIYRTPNPFVCDIRPRSEAALRLIMEDA